MVRRIIYGCLLVLFVSACLDPYHLNIEGYNNLLVVDGLITDENKSHTVILRRSTSNIEEDSPLESGAHVYITDDKGGQYTFAEFGPGLYKSDSTILKVAEGFTYTLHIRTSDERTYQSAPCTILPKTTLDRIYYKKNTRWDENNEYENIGLSIYVDGKGEPDTYVRWMYKEDWKFSTPYPEKYIINEANEAIPIPVVNVICWKNNSSNIINIHSFGNQVASEIKAKEITFIPTALNDKLSIRYSILVKQLSISKEEYEYWRKLSESTEEVGDVFGKQPFSIKGNISNINDPDEPVLGFFQTGSIVTKRMYINRSVLSDLKLPLLSPTERCHIDTFKVDGLAWFSPYQIYDEMVINGNLKLFEPMFSENGLDVLGLFLTIPRCSDCSVTGAVNPPIFWED